MGNSAVKEMAGNTLISFENLQMVLEEYGMLVVEHYKQHLMVNGHLATEKLITSITLLPVKDLEVSISLEEYWKRVEYDNRAHWAPPEAILSWVKAKHIVPSKTYDGKLPTEKQLAYLISRKISEKGTTGTHDLRDAMQAVNIQFEQRIGDAVAKDIEGALTSVLTELQTK